MGNSAIHPNSGIGFDYALGKSWDVLDNQNRRNIGDLINKPVDFVQQTQPNAPFGGTAWANTSNGTYNVYTSSGNGFSGWQVYGGDGMFLVGRGGLAGICYVKSGNNWLDYIAQAKTDIANIQADKMWRESVHGYGGGVIMSVGHSWLKGSGHATPYADNNTLIFNTSIPNKPYITVLKEGRYCINFGQLLYANIINIDHRTELFISGRVIDAFQKTTPGNTQDTIKLSACAYIFAGQTVEVGLSAGSNIQTNLAVFTGRFSMYSM